MCDYLTPMCFSIFNNVLFSIVCMRCGITLQICETCDGGEGMDKPRLRMCATPLPYLIYIRTKESLRT